MARIYLLAAGVHDGPKDFRHRLLAAGHSVHVPQSTEAEHNTLLEHPIEYPIGLAAIAEERRVMSWADTCILLVPALPYGFLVSGWFIGAGKRSILVHDHLKLTAWDQLFTDFANNTDEALQMLEGDR
ncbi:MAG: hypothetical protein JJ902_05215 [Roseibium sp.]|nr:hypothetical protein [Roseibium sp.]